MAGNITKIKDGSYRLRYRDHSKNVQAKSDRQNEWASPRERRLVLWR